jgi:hypothetical protein
VVSISHIMIVVAFHSVSDTLYSVSFQCIQDLIVQYVYYHLCDLCIGDNIVLYIAKLGVFGCCTPD